jgi:phosphoesterase RecJ-like protein
MPYAVIDHHSSGETYGNIRYIDSSAPSTTYLIQHIIEGYGFPLEKTEAEYILFGLCTDTGFFRHLTKDTAHVFQSVSRLIEAGASPNKIHQMMYGRRSLEARHLLGTILKRVESYNDSKILVAHETLEDTDSYGIHNRDSDTFYLLLQTVKNVEAVILIREEKPGVCSVGLRSNNDIDMGSIARSFNGGGHKKAAGFEWRGSIDEIKDKLILMIGDQY